MVPSLEISRAAAIKFLYVDLELAFVICEQAKRTPRNTEQFQSRLEVVATAVDDLSKRLWSVRPDPADLDQITAQIERLKFEVESLSSCRIPSQLSKAPGSPQSLGLPRSEASFTSVSLRHRTITFSAILRAEFGSLRLRLSRFSDRKTSYSK
jgi:hypothetical protein